MIHGTYGKLNKQISYLPLTIKQIRIVIHSTTSYLMTTKVKIKVKFVKFLQKICLFSLKDFHFEMKRMKNFFCESYFIFSRFLCTNKLMYNSVFLYFFISFFSKNHISMNTVQNNNLKTLLLVRTYFYATPISCCLYLSLIRQIFKFNHTQKSCGRRKKKTRNHII